jgi:hypothetical protein
MELSSSNVHNQLVSVKIKNIFTILIIMPAEAGVWELV